MNNKRRIGAWSKVGLVLYVYKEIMDHHAAGFQIRQMRWTTAHAIEKIGTAGEEVREGDKRNAGGGGQKICVWISE